MYVQLCACSVDDDTLVFTPMYFDALFRAAIGDGLTDTHILDVLDFTISLNIRTNLRLVAFTSGICLATSPSCRRVGRQHRGKIQLLLQ